MCAEPSAGMLAQVPRDDRLIPVAASAEDLAFGRVALPHDGYDAILLKEVLHHIDDRVAVIGGMARLLKPDGRMLVVMLPTRITYPLFGEALKVFAEHQPDPADIAAAMRDSGLAAAVTQDSRLARQCRWNLLGSTSIRNSPPITSRCRSGPART